MHGAGHGAGAVQRCTGPMSSSSVVYRIASNFRGLKLP